MFYLFANCNFVPDRYEDWQAAYDDLADYVYANETTTKTYYFGIPMDYASDIPRTTSMLAFEAYGEREDLYKTHFTSPAMGEFLKKIPPTMTSGLDLTNAECVGGYIDKPGDMRECGIMQDTKIVCKSSTARRILVEKLKRLAAEVEALEDTEHLGVFTFMTFICQDDETSARIFARFKSAEVMEKHLRRKEVIEFWLGSKEEVASMEARGYVPNGKGWLHR